LSWIFIHVGEALAFCYAVKQLEPVWKEFHTRQEFVFILVVDVLFTFVFVVLLILKLDKGIIFKAVDYVVMARSASFLLISVVWPTYCTYFSIDAPIFPNRSCIESLQSVLTNPLACRYFYLYCQNEDSMSVMLEFWMEIELFEDSWKDESQGDMNPNFLSRRIYEKYFDMSLMPTMISANLDLEGQLREEDEFKMQNVMDKIVTESAIRDLAYELDRCESSNLTVERFIFSDLQMQVEESLESHYKLFLRSRECKELLQELNVQEYAFRKLIENDLL